ncbi:MAG TPA: 30S ribosomal protein S27ae [Candidatus Nanoarchaeia archaeon]|nr:30S ribosomal protein S27ae [Candidatus Nanoarchaeia archaeon]
MAKKKVNPHKTTAIWKKYKLVNGKTQRERTCPKCEPGTFLALHKDRIYCGKCGYMEKTGK